MDIEIKGKIKASGQKGGGVKVSENQTPCCHCWLGKVLMEENGSERARKSCRGKTKESLQHHADFFFWGRGKGVKCKPR